MMRSRLSARVVRLFQTHTRSTGPAAFLAAIWWCLAAPVSLHAAETPKTVSPVPPPPAVLIQRAELKSLDRQYEFIGRVEALEKVELRARVKGFLGARLFKDGDTVKAGQTLFTIDREQYEATVAQKRAQVASAEATLAFAKQQLSRAQELSGTNSNAISKATLDERTAEQARAAAGVLEAKAALSDAEIQLSYTEIKSPIDGRVGRAAVSPGNLVSPETGVLATVVAENSLQILFPITQRELLEYRRRAGDKERLTVRVRLADGSLYEEAGIVDFLDVQVDPRTDGQIVRAMMPNKNRVLTDGQTARVVLEEESSEKVIAIPRAAVIIDQSGPYVFIVNSDNLVEQRRITLGEERNGVVAVPQGLKENDAVVVQGLQRIRAGVTVTAQMEKTPEAGPGTAP